MDDGERSPEFMGDICEIVILGLIQIPEYLIVTGTQTQRIEKKSYRNDCQCKNNKGSGKKHPVPAFLLKMRLPHHLQLIQTLFPFIFRTKLIYCILIPLSIKTVHAVRVFLQPFQGVLISSGIGIHLIVEIIYIGQMGSRTQTFGDSC